MRVLEKLKQRRKGYANNRKLILKTKCVTQDGKLVSSNKLNEGLYFHQIYSICTLKLTRGSWRQHQNTVERTNC